MLAQEYARVCEITQQQTQHRSPEGITHVWLLSFAGSVSPCGSLISAFHNSLIRSNRFSPVGKKSVAFLTRNICFAGPEIIIFLFFFF